jgi:hypothetical protein
MCIQQKAVIPFTMSLFGLEVAAIRFVYERPFGVSSFSLPLLGADVVLSLIAPAPQLRHVTPEVVN